MTDPTRRDSLLAGAGAIAAAASASGAAAEVRRYPDDPQEAIPLWKGAPPGAPASLPTLSMVERSTTAGVRDRAATGVAQPVMEVFRPKRPNGAAMLILPGGGYVRVVVDREGYETARLLAAAGVTCFVLRYRLPGDGWAQRTEAPLQDAQRAMRLIRSGARGFGVDPRRVGVMGFSAGGHLAATLLTRHEAVVYPARDAADRLSARPDLGALIYPVIAMAGPAAHAGSRAALIGADASAAAAAAVSPDLAVRPDSPPVWLAHAADDASVPVENALAMFAALRRARVASELHVYEEGGHGFGLQRAEGKPVRGWPDLLLAWLQRHAFIPAKAAKGSR